MTVREYLAEDNDQNNVLVTVWIAIGVATAILTILVFTVVVIALAHFLRKSSQQKTECDNSYSTLHREVTQLKPQSLHTCNDLYDHIQLSMGGSRGGYWGCNPPPPPKPFQMQQRIICPMLAL